MFKHRIDPLVQTEINRIDEVLGTQTADIKKLKDDFAAIEEKLDALLEAAGKPANRSITENEKPEPLAIAKGHTPWSQRKRQREQKSRDPGFVEKVIKGAATTDAPAKE